MHNIRILILDDEKRVRDEIEEFLLGKKFIVKKAGLPSEADMFLQHHQIDILILDIKLPEMDGINYLKKVKSEYPDTEVIMISGHGDMNAVIEAMRYGAADFFQKPFRLIEINNTIERTKRFISLQQKLKEVEKSYGFLSKEIEKEIGQRLIGKSSGIKKVIELMSKIAETNDTSVLITGESGTGKELVARGIHFMSKRKNQYFYSVNCSAIPESLFESEFFGHKKGAFTGASEDKAGWFEFANNGTLFLDEIGDMPQSQQAKLLRVLEEKMVSRVGTHKMKEVNVRVIAASNQDLESMAENKEFRFDLYHRLSTFIIHIPPLRERREDIPLLIKGFVKDYSEKMGKNIQKVDEQAMKLLKKYDYPGNIRELRNLVERAVIICEDNSLKKEHFRMITDKLEYPDTNVAKEPAPDDMDLEKTEIRLIKKALNLSDNNKSKAADMLNITWQSLDRRLKKYKIEA
ncbi:MAG: sigma-54 dependent transcriptional regulator [Bacteroidales bacterium]|nr:sigma-54 dependent transcriptional regulator [Bacteroidales bacterium]MCF8386847.1 sigma-54 dependent transcriptional regulator [Bacteroidales bacterium]MCF8399265.1 sigma-54 dependent transcriptional regulator [Bacteroidales bacterium]